MQTNFTPEQLADPKTRDAEKILRTCVHCGLCTATCSTYVLVGDERDSPRGRIYLMKDMFERGRAASPEVKHHVDRCLSCLSCMTTCPSGVDYMHLVDAARTHIEQTGQRSLKERLVRGLLSATLPYPKRFRRAVQLAPLGRPFRGLLRRIGLKEVAAMIDLAPAKLPSSQRFTGPGTAQIKSERRGRVIMLAGCAQQVLRPEINDATIRLLARRGIEVVVANNAGCCGALVHHMGREAQAIEAVRRNIDAWWKEIEREPVDAIVINASGCGTTVKDYGHMMKHVDGYADKAAKVSSLTLDITEYLARTDIGPPSRWSSLRIAYHSACSLQHGQQVTSAPKMLLKKAGFSVLDVPESHICCGSAGTYNILQPELAGELKARKTANLLSTKADLVAAGNIGCITHLGIGLDMPIVHTVELLDWAYGGPVPRGLERLKDFVAQVPGPARTPDDYIAA
jgi:glycolate oxidase iron-sulfur subunit